MVERADMPPDGVKDGKERYPLLSIPLSAFYQAKGGDDDVLLYRNQSFLSLEFT
jgi:hypothetical protein